MLGIRFENEKPMLDKISGRTRQSELNFGLSYIIPGKVVAFRYVAYFDQSRF